MSKRRIKPDSVEEDRWLDRQIMNLTAENESYWILLLGVPGLIFLAAAVSPIRSDEPILHLGSAIIGLILLFFAIGRYRTFKEELGRRLRGK